MESFLHTVFFFIIALGILISFHEFGHYWVAKRLGVKVLRFSIGFGKPLWRYQKSPEDTEFIIAVLPLGGYVKMADENEGPVKKEDLHAAFNRQPLSTRSAIVAAGPIFNLLLAVLIYWVVLIAGQTGIKPVIGEVPVNSAAGQAGLREGDQIISISGRTTPTWELALGEIYGAIVDSGTASLVIETAGGAEQQVTLQVPDAAAMDPSILREALGLYPWQPHLDPVIGRVEPSSPASLAGLVPGDRVLSANDRPIKSWDEFVDIIKNSPEQQLTMHVINKSGEQRSVSLWPAAIVTDHGSTGRIGAAVEIPAGIFDGMQVEYRLGPIEAVPAAIAQTWNYSIMSLKMLGKMLFGQASVDNLSGPITIAQYAGQSASMGWIAFAKFLAMVSISLGVLNLLPIPVLDGGHLMFYLIEWIKGKPLSDHAIGMSQQIGIFLLLGLMSLAFVLDIEKLIN